jgi:hypothetical protein
MKEMANEEDVKDAQTNLYIRNKIEKLYDEAKKTKDYGRLFSELNYLMPKSLCQDFDPDYRIGFLKFLKFLTDYMEKHANFGKEK